MGAQSFLTAEEQRKIIECVKDVETRTSGEIVPVIASESYHYPSAVAFGSLLLGVAAAVAACMYLGSEDMWMFLAIFLGAYCVFQIVLRYASILKKPFVSRRQMAEEVDEAAITNFYLNGLHHTRDQTGIIIYVSVYERMVQVLADKGINDKVDPQVWNEVVRIVTKGIRTGAPADGICQAIARCGELITEHFPIKADDTDELPNLIIDGEAKQ
ncbi:TPM domain-containing protein [Salidesulfovibrio onnuriiensis]|uniref:TPM domain-containing protein n=1 Tax=Salidesulfovibrio onnuriiensis TaxID=2583823 RepID=UPI0011CC4F7D|nr:hypothetical protein [Salidesulfovibrio onnuriiensis]